jgi:hypothetical protein
MNTVAMILTIVGFCMCWVSGPVGFLGLGLAFAGIAISARGMTHPKTSPSGLSMDVAAWVYGMITWSFGVAFQVREAGLFDRVKSSGISMETALTAGLIAYVLFIVVQLAGRRTFRWAAVAAAIVLFLCAAAGLSMALLHADAAGVKIMQ